MIERLVWILPLLPAVAALVMLGVRGRRVLAALDLLTSLAVLALAALLVQRVYVSGPVAAGPLRADEIGAPFLLLVGLLAVATSIYTTGWMRRELEIEAIKPASLRFYYALVHGFIATMLLTVVADNLGILWIAMEGTTISSAILVGFHGHRDGLEAAWKYIIVTTIGISFGLFGTVLIYAAAAHAQGGVSAGAMSWSTIAGIAPRLDSGIVRIGFIFVLVGYGTKAGLAPVHMWLPDAHSQAPTPVSALLSGVLIKCALLAIMRFHTIARGACGPEFSGKLLLLFGLLSVIVATPFILTQRDLKRLLGYSSVEHVGVIALALGFGGTLGTYAALLHVINHGVTKALMFFVSGDVIARHDTRDIHAIRGYLKVAPWAGTLLLLGVFALAGTPPFSIFVSELLMLRAGIRGGHWVAVAVFLLMVAVIFAGLVHHVSRMAFGRAEAAAEPRADDAAASLKREAAVPVAGMLLLAALMLLFGVFLPRALDQMLTRATESILG